MKENIHPAYPYTNKNFNNEFDDYKTVFAVNLNFELLIDKRFEGQQINYGIPYLDFMYYTYAQLLESLTNSNMKDFVSNQLSNSKPNDWISYFFKGSLKNNKLIGFSFHGKVVIDANNKQEAKEVLKTNKAFFDYLRLKLLHKYPVSELDLSEYLYSQTNYSLELTEPGNLLDNRDLSLYKRITRYSPISELDDLIHRFSNFNLSTSSFHNYDLRMDLITSSLDNYLVGFNKIAIVNIAQILEIIGVDMINNPNVVFNISVVNDQQLVTEANREKRRGNKRISIVWKVLLQFGYITEDFYCCVDTIRHIRNLIIHPPTNTHSRVIRSLSDSSLMKAVSRLILTVVRHILFAESSPDLFGGGIVDIDQNNTTFFNIKWEIDKKLFGPKLMESLPLQECPECIIQTCTLPNRTLQNFGCRDHHPNQTHNGTTDVTLTSTISDLLLNDN